MLCQRGLWGRFPQGWLYEPKIDGSRTLAFVSGGEVKLVSRHDSDYTLKFPEVASALRGLPDCVLDGEIACREYLKTAGRTHLEDPIRIELEAKFNPATYYVFDILRLVGEWVLTRPLAERKELLRKTVPSGGGVEVVEPSPLEELVRRAEAGELEGVVAKHPRSPYEFRRSAFWVKFRPERTEELPIIGWEDSDKPGRPYRSLILLRGGREVRASSGLTDRELAETAKLFASVPHERRGTKNYFIGKHAFTAEVSFSNAGGVPYRFPVIKRLKLEGSTFGGENEAERN